MTKWQWFALNVQKSLTARFCTQWIAKQSLIFIALTLLYLPLLRADPLDQWHWCNPKPQGSVLSSIAFGNNRFVAVGEGGTILTSADGIDWTGVDSPTTHSLSKIAFLNGEFFAVGEGSAIITSTDGLYWYGIISGVYASLKSIAFGLGTYVIVGDSSTILTSTDGIVWVPKVAPKPGLHLNGVAFGNATFIAIAQEGDIIQSSDAESWAKQAASSSYASDVIYLNNGFLILDNMDYSTNGSNWITLRESSACNAVTFADGYYVGVGIGGVIYVTDNSTNWWKAVTKYQSSDDLKGIAFGNGSFVAVGVGGVIRSSTDKLTWPIRSRALTNGGMLYGVKYINNEFVTVGESGVANGYGEDSPILFSGTSGNWYRRSSNYYADFWDIEYNQGLYVLATTWGIRTTRDWISWSTPNCGMSTQISGLIRANDLFLLLSWYGGISTSPDGTNWTLRESGTAHNLWGAAFGNGLFVVVGQNFGDSTGVCVTSHDGVTWTPHQSMAALRNVAFGSGIFVRVGDKGHISSSTDGLNWTTRSSQTGASLYGVAYGDGYFVAVGNRGTLVTSPNGVDWSNLPMPTSLNLNRVAYGGGTFVITGDNSAILQSASTYPSIEIYKYPDHAELNLVGGFDRYCTIQATANLGADWKDIALLPPGKHQFLEYNPSLPAKFYRLVMPR